MQPRLGDGGVFQPEFLRGGEDDAIHQRQWADHGLDLSIGWEGQAMKVYGGFEVRQRCRLLLERERLRDLLDDLRAAALSRSGFEPHDKDDQEATIPANAIEERLAAIDQAIDRMNLDRYGLCDMCGSVIPIRRLEANPATATCRDCMALQHIAVSAVGSASL